MSILNARLSSTPVAFAIGTAICLLGLAIGIPLGAPLATIVACSAIMLLGLPHGTLDLDLFRQEQPGVARPVIFFLYVGFAGAMAGAWLAHPIFALALFFVLAVAHFGEDWTSTGSTFLARCTALALLSIPALTHRTELIALFSALVGSDASAVFVDLLRLMSPVALMVAFVAVGLLWSIGERPTALGGALALIAMGMLPPVVGFALFFCLFHSPRHLHAGLTSLSLRPSNRHGMTIVLLTLAATGIAAIIYSLGTELPAPDRLMTASFTTLSILTLPHMAVPIVLRALRQRGADGDVPPNLLPVRDRVLLLNA